MLVVVMTLNALHSLMVMVMVMMMNPSAVLLLLLFGYLHCGGSGDGAADTWCLV
jgi:hypothetical protein